MKYITGIQALNIENSKNTCGDWHWSGMDWSNLTLAESSNSILGDWGIEGPKEVPDNAELYYVADDMRAVLDLMQEGKTGYLIGFRNDFICTDEYNDEFFSKVLLLKSNKHWDAINRLMEREFKGLWVGYCIKCGERTLDKEDSKMQNIDTSWQLKHKNVMMDFLLWLNSRTDKFVLKGGTSLLFCYGLTRFSEDIDLDGFDKRFFDYVDRFIVEAQRKYPGISYRKAKDTDTVKRAMVHFGQRKPLKIEVSYRTAILRPYNITKINGICVYNIRELMKLKIKAYDKRDKLRDLYDVTFIFTRYGNMLGRELLDDLQDTLQSKGLEQFDYLIRNDNDPLINKDNLAQAFISMWYALGLG